MKVKMKTKKGVAKRFKKTGTGKFKYKRPGTAHILTKMSSKRKRKLKNLGVASDTENKRLSQMMPY